MTSASPSFPASASFEDRARALGFEIASFETIEKGLFHNAVQFGDLIYTAGQVSSWNGADIKGFVGGDVTLEQAQEAARYCAANCLRAVKTLCGGLDRVERVVKLLGMVNVAPGFSRTPEVINGASAFINDVFGARGAHARSAVGMVLPSSYAVEIEMIVGLKKS
jgi:enamine deaminase RidA (YjgF/YER057c/UK114 family)